MQCPADRDANQHADPRLLGEQGPDGHQALGFVLGRSRRSGGIVMGLGEPAARFKRLSENARQLRRRLAHHRLSRAEALGVFKGGNRRVKLRLGVLLRRHRF